MRHDAFLASRQVCVILEKEQLRNGPGIEQVPCAKLAINLAFVFDDDTDNLFDNTLNAAFMVCSVQ